MSSLKVRTSGVASGDPIAPTHRGCPFRLLLFNIMRGKKILIPYATRFSHNFPTLTLFIIHDKRLYLECKSHWTASIGQHIEANLLRSNK